MKVGILSFSPIADDPRVRRLGDTLHNKGWEVTAIGLSGARSPAPAWTILECDPTGPSATASHDPLSKLERFAGHTLLGNALKSLGRMIASGDNPDNFPTRVAAKLFSTPQPIRAACRSLTRKSVRPVAMSEQERLQAFWRLSPALPAMLAQAQGLPKMDCWVANDWWCLPIAHEIAKKTGSRFIYDSHELATEEYAERPEWVENSRPIVQAVENRFIREAKIVSAVSPGICRHLSETYELEKPVLVIRNVPNRDHTPARDAAETIRVLYHGVVAPGRGLEACIRSVASWPNEMNLTIRGPISIPSYRNELLDLIKQTGTEARVTLAPPVPMPDLVRAAAPFDIGILALPGHSSHNQYALPNKTFEYLMAGLAVAVTDLPDLRDLLAETKAGFLLGSGSDEEIALAMQSLTRRQLNEMRAAALMAAEKYNWEAESSLLIDHIDQMFEH